MRMKATSRQKPRIRKAVKKVDRWAKRHEHDAGMSGAKARFSVAGMDHRKKKRTTARTK